MMETLEAGELCFPELLNTSCRKQKYSRSKDMIIHILLFSISLLTVALNLLVIISISHFRRLHTSTNLFLLSLAVSDLFMGLVMPLELYFAGACWLYGDILCTLASFVIIFIISVSVGNMVLISLDRFVAICDPLHYSMKITQRRVQICVCLCWSCSALYGCLMLNDLLIQPGRYNSCVGECVIVYNYITETVDLVFTFIVPITVIIVLYMRVFVVAVSQARAMRSHTVAVKLQPAVTAKKSELKAARTLGIVISVFLICFCPYYCVSLVGQDSLVSASSLIFFLFLLYLNSCLNPIIYTFFYPWFRKAIKLIVTLQIFKPDSCEANIL